MVKKTRINASITAILLSIVFGTCGCGDSNKHKVDLSGHEVNIKINRLEDDLFSVKSTDDYQNLDLSDSSLMKAYKRGIMGSITSDGFIPVDQSAQKFMSFINNQDMRHLYETVDSVFDDLGSIEEGLSDAFSHYNYYFPDQIIPSFYSVVSPFRAQNITTEKTMAICLDMYLGPTFHPYQSPILGFPNFMIDRFKKDYIVPNAVKAWMESDYSSNPKDHRLLAEMIHQGKILYAMDLLLPSTEDSLKIGYKNGKIEWCITNESLIWNHLIDENLLYSTELEKHKGVVADGPFSKGNNVPQQSPPRIAIWTGWQIVRAYMENKPDVSLEQLLDDYDFDTILSESGYKP